MNKDPDKSTDLSAAGIEVSKRVNNYFINLYRSFYQIKLSCMCLQFLNNKKCISHERKGLRLIPFLAYKEFVPLHIS